MKLLSDFKSFALKGNIVDLATGVIIGTAFGKIVSSLVADVFTPLLGILVGGVNFTTLSYSVQNVMTGQEVVLKYGNFLQSVFDFLIVALAIFFFLKVIAKATARLKKEEAQQAAVSPSEEVLLLRDIRDSLVKK